MRDFTLQEGNYEEFPTLADFRRATGQEPHGLELDYDVFPS